MTNGLKSWSYTTLSDYERCPFYLKCKKIDKLPEPKGPALDRGIKIHKKCEDYLTTPQLALPKECLKFEQSFIDLKALDPIVEQEWCFRKNWSQTHMVRS